EKMMSVAFSPRNIFVFCSPMTQRTASMILLFPEPLGPINPVMWSFCKVRVTLSAKDLNPLTIIFFKYIRVLPYAGHHLAQGTDVCSARAKVAKLIQWI